MSSVFLALSLDDFRHAATSEYVMKRVDGFTVLISPASKADEATLAPVLPRLAQNLEDIGKTIPKAAFRKLHAVKFWLEHDNPDTPGMVFHPDAGWLKEHGYNVDKVDNVEIGNLAHFISWHAQQPWMVLHELSHAWEFRFMNEASRKELDAAFATAQNSVKYESVEHWDGKKRRAYALTNAHEYFAEISEAYFGKNDFFPFTREDLKAFDPQGYALVEHAWGIRKNRMTE